MIETQYVFTSDSIPLLATAIHNGHGMPEELLAICGISEADRLREEDPFTGRIASEFPNRLILKSSRFAVDLNRAPEKAVYLKPEDCWGLPARTQAVPEDLLRRLRDDYDSWYSLLQYQIERLLKLHPFLGVLDLHSFNHRRGGPDAEPDPQLQNPDIIIGRSNLQEKYHPLAQSLCDHLNGREYQGKALDCRQDVKFTGGYLSRWLNHHYPDRLLCLAIEFKKTFMDEWSGMLDEAAFGELKRLFRSAVSKWLNETCGFLI
jgi:N-formylglutamate amidohydrolase